MLVTAQFRCHDFFCCRRHGKIRSNVRTNGAQREIPKPGTAEWAEYVQTVIMMDPETFDTHMSQLEQHAPEVHTALCAEVYEDSEEEEEEQE